MVKVAIYGASGYTGQELLRLLLRHPRVEITAVTSRRYAGVRVSEIFPLFTGIIDLTYVDASPEQVSEYAEVVFLALPHGVSMKVAPFFLDAGKKVIDLSADFRLKDVDVYEKWYEKHVVPHMLHDSVYGLPELYRDAIVSSRFIANPGCYPTTVILGLAPMVKFGLIDTTSIIVDAKSGVSGAGREPQVGTLFCEVDEGFMAYKVGRHRHTPEMEQELSLLAGKSVKISFTPHLLPLSRGILSTMYATINEEVTVADLVDVYRSFYKECPFVRIYRAGMFPNVSSVRGSNYCDIGFAVDGRTRRVIVVSVIDNLIKGASGQAIQNMNLLCGFTEETGLTMLPLFP